MAVSWLGLLKALRVPGRSSNFQLATRPAGAVGSSDLKLARMSDAVRAIFQMRRSSSLPSQCAPAYGDSDSADVLSDGPADVFSDGPADVFSGRSALSEWSASSHSSASDLSGRHTPDEGPLRPISSGKSLPTLPRGTERVFTRAPSRYRSSRRDARRNVAATWCHAAGSTPARLNVSANSRPLVRRPARIMLPPSRTKYGTSAVTPLPLLTIWRSRCLKPFGSSSLNQTSKVQSPVTLRSGVAGASAKPIT